MINIINEIEYEKIHYCCRGRIIKYDDIYYITTDREEHDRRLCLDLDKDGIPTGNISYLPLDGECIEYIIDSITINIK